MRPLEVEAVLLGGRQGVGPWRGEVNDPLGLRAADDLGHLGGVGDVHDLDAEPLADLRLEEVGLAAGRVLGRDDVVAVVEEAADGVQSGESHAAYDHYAHWVLLRDGVDGCADDAQE